MTRRSHAAPAARVATLIAALIAGLAPAAAEERPAGWQTWTWEGSCYAILYAEAGGAASTGTDRAYIAVKHVPKEKTFDGVTVASGLNMPIGTEGLIEVNGQEYPLLVFRGAGFVRSGEPEKGLVEGLAKATEARVTWVLKDQMTVQTYKVGGFPAAHKVIDAACPRQASGEASAPATEDAKPPLKPQKASRRTRG